MLNQNMAGITSVLIPLYNHARFIERALDSLLSSNCSKIELVICDDASTDDSHAIAQKWLTSHASKFSSVLLLANPVNIGITANLNRLSSSARGEFITFFASDDLLAEQAIDIQRDYLASHPDKDFVFSNCAIVDIEGNIIKPRVISPTLALLLHLPGLMMINALFNWNVVWARLFARRQAFSRFGAYIQEHSIEDRWSALKILNSGKYGYMDQIVHLYRFRGLEAHPAIDSAEARRDFHDIERRIHGETRGLLYCLLWVRRLPFRTNRGKWPARL